jgi:hypothetical protein
MGFERTAILALARRPTLLFEAIRAWFAMRREGGLGPATSYLEWRRYTAYGDRITTTSAHDLVKYLQWRREMRAMSKWERVA